MSVLYVSPDAPALVRGAAQAILVLHIGGGTAGVLSGLTALLAPKGERVHRFAGKVFLASMLVMAAIGGAVSPFLPHRISAIAGLFTFYLVATGFATVRRKEGNIGVFEYGAFFAALAIVAAALALDLLTGSSPAIDGEPRAALYMFLGLATLAALGDLNLLRRRGISGGRRIARHLWRMGAAMLLASLSALSQQQMLPSSVRGSPFLYLPVLVTAAVMIYWLLRIPLANRFKRVKGAPA